MTSEFPKSGRCRVLVLGGTSEASALAQVLAADERFDAVLSFAGRTQNPKPPPIPFRVGGFGGIEGLEAFLRDQAIEAVVDATHPFAAQMSAHAIAACAAVHVPLIALERPAWTPQAGDRWIEVPDLEAAALALGEAPRRVFLAIGRMHLDAFAGQPQHDYLVRLVDAPPGPLPLPRIEVVVGRGPFSVENDRAMLRAHGTGIVVAKNAGGSGAEAKIVAARDLGLPIVMIARPAIAPRASVGTVPEVMDWLAHQASATLRGV